MKSFTIPEFYRSPLFTRIKSMQKMNDPRKSDMQPFILDFGPVEFIIARHFGFCYGVENAIEISFRAVAENPGKRIFLLSQMIHNPAVNQDLINHGVNFLQDTEGKQLISFDELKENDVVIIPAFGAPVETENLIKKRGISVEKYNTTCPFVERVWKKSKTLGDDQFSIVIHGKYTHEETRATFSRAIQNSAAVIVKNIEESKKLEPYIRGSKTQKEFELEFKNKFSEGFNIEHDLKRLGVINQTTMLASETQEIAEYLKKLMVELYGEKSFKEHFADTRDTLCYATNENQDATLGLLNTNADLAIVVGGYNSSNTSHLVELLERKFNTFFISSDSEIISEKEIHHFNYPLKKKEETKHFLPNKEKVRIILTSGASCPDSIVEKVLDRILGFFPSARKKEEIIKGLD